MLKYLEENEYIYKNYENDNELNNENKSYKITFISISDFHHTTNPNHLEYTIYKYKNLHSKLYKKIKDEIKNTLKNIIKKMKIIGLRCIVIYYVEEYIR